MSGHAEVEDQIERLKQGNTLPENEVKALCEKVRRRRSERSGVSATLSACCDNYQTIHLCDVGFAFIFDCDRVTGAFSRNHNDRFEIEVCQLYGSTSLVCSLFLNMPVLSFFACS